MRNHPREFTDTSAVVAAMQACDRLAVRAAAAEAPREVVVEATSGPFTLRRWEAGETTRLNSAHWQNAVDAPINEDLVAMLSSLRARCGYEAANNPWIEGMIFTHQVDVVGPAGPTLQVQSSNREYNEALEKWFKRWWNPQDGTSPKPDAAGKRSGPQMLSGWLGRWWKSGEFFEQKVSASSDESPITLRLLGINPKRVDTPADVIGAGNVVLGIESNRDGRPLRYYVQDSVRFGPYAAYGTNYTPVPRDLMLHGFWQDEEDQVRGFPWLSSSLPAAADLRDYDDQVLDAARSAADHAICLHTTHPDAPFIEISEEVEVSRRTYKTMPPGWTPFQLQPGQPAANYVEYRRERQAELGRSRNMPLMIIRLDASKHNYSSARFDSQNYQRGNVCIQAGLTVYLFELVADVARELALAAKARDPRVEAVLANPPADVQYAFTGWPVRPHVDPVKERNAHQVGLQTLQESLHDVLATEGKDFEQHMRTLEREFARMAEVKVGNTTLADLFLSMFLRGGTTATALSTVVDDEQSTEIPEETAV